MTNQFTDEQAEEAVNAVWAEAMKHRGVGGQVVQAPTFEFIQVVHAALEAAAGVAPQAPEGRELDALRALIENRARVIEGFSGAPDEISAEQKAIARSIRRDLEDHDFEFSVAPVQPSSTVDEDALAEVIRRSYENEQGLKIRDDKRTARAVAEWLRGESR